MLNSHGSSLVPAGYRGFSQTRRESSRLLLVVMRDIRELGTILSIWAHPDDEAYLCGGIMAMAAAAGSRVVCVTASSRRAWRDRSDEVAARAAPAIREAELAACLGILGVKEHRWLGYPDGGCADVDIDTAADRSQRSFAR